MGIKNLQQFLVTKKIDCFFQISLVHFSHLRVAMDGMNWIYKYVYRIYKNILDKQEDILEEIDKELVFQNIVDEFIKFNNRLLNYKITPVWIWDGVSKNNKAATQADRVSSRKKIREEVSLLREELLNMPILERPIDLLNKYKKKLASCSSPKFNDIERLKKISKELGVPTIIADDEAENLASSMAVERIVAAVWTSDTDTYPLGAPLVINKFEKKRGFDYVSGIYTNKILKELELSHEEFRDFCILLGTDFNDNLDRVGPVGALTLIKKYRNLETVTAETRHNTYGLKFKEVRMQLTPYDTSYHSDLLKVNKNINEDDLRNKISSQSLDLFLSNIKNLPDPVNVPRK